MIPHRTCGASAWGLLWLGACGTAPEEAAPFASDRCGAEVCTRPPGGVSGHVPDTTARADAGSEPGTAGAEPRTLSGEIVIRESADGSAGRPLAGATVEVWVDAADGTRSRGTYEGSSFSLDVAGPPPYWARARQTSGVESLVATLVRIDGDFANVVVPLLEQRVIEDIGNNLLAPVPPDPTRATAIVTVERRGARLSGVSVAVAVGTVAYDSGTLFSDGLDATQALGTAALFGLPAVPFPGGSAEITLRFEGTDERLELELSAGAVTLLTWSM